MPNPSNTGYEIVRGIGRWDLVALMVNITIGSGILGLPAKLFTLTGVYSVVVLVLCAVLLAIVAICFAEVGSRFTSTGGPYLFTRTAFGTTPGFIVGWLYWVSRVLTFATICNLLVVYVARACLRCKVPGRASRSSRWSCSASCSSICWAPARDDRQQWLDALKVSLLAVFGVVGISLRIPGPTRRLSCRRREISAMRMRLGIFAFVGFEAALVSAGETRDPRRDIPFSVAMSLLIVLVLYAGVQSSAWHRSVPGCSTAPFADAAVTLGSAGERVIAVGAIVIMLGSLNSGFLATSRLPFAFAEQGDLPAVLRTCHPRFRTPHIAIFGSAAWHGLPPARARFSPRSCLRRARAWSSTSRAASP